MKKLSIGVLVVSALVLAGCGGGSDKEVKALKKENTELKNEVTQLRQEIKQLISPEKLLNRGKQQFDNGKLVKARNTFETLIETFPKSAESKEAQTYLDKPEMAEKAEAAKEPQKKKKN